MTIKIDDGGSDKPGLWHCQSTISDVNQGKRQKKELSNWVQVADLLTGANRAGVLQSLSPESLQ